MANPPSSVAETYHLTHHDHVVGNSPLHSACCSGKVDIVKLLILEQSCDINGENYQGNTPLGLACKAGHRHVVSFLLTLSACDLNHRNKAGNTPLHTACLEGNCNIVTILCREGGCKVDTKNRYGDTPLGLSCSSGNLDIVKFLVNQKGCNVASKNRDGNTSLHLACHSGYVGVVRLFTSLLHCDVNSTNKDRDTPLHLACQSGRLDIVNYLTAVKGSNLNYYNLDGNIPLYTAIISHQKGVAMFLCKVEGCDITHLNWEGDNALHLASAESWSDMVDLLARVRHCDINSQNNQGNTALHIASLKGHNAVVEVLIQQPLCDINRENQHGNTPLSLACQNGWEDIVKLLVRNIIQNCNLNHKNKSGITPIHFACYNRHQTIVEILIRDKRCDVEYKDMNENTPLGLVCNLGWTGTIEYLITERQCFVDSRNKYGDTPLHLTCSVGYLAVVKLLVVQKKCDISCQNNRGDTPFSLACQSNLKVVKFLSAQKEHKSLIQNNDGNTPLHHACVHSRLDIVKFLVSDLKHDVNCENNDGNTPLSFTLASDLRWKNIIDIIQFLVSLPQCHINHQNKAGDTPLHIASRDGCTDAIVLLSSVEYCNINLQNKAGDTPLHIACRRGHTDAVFVLSDTEHCNFNLQNKSGQTPVKVAMYCNPAYILQLMLKEPHYLPSLLESVNQDKWIMIIINLLSSDRELTVPSHFQSKLDVVKFVIQHKLWDPKCPNENGSIALHFASSDLVDYLVHEQGCDVNHQNDRGNTPMHVACLRGDTDTVAILILVERCNSSLQNEDGNTPLHIACRDGFTDGVVLISGIGHCNFNRKNKSGQTPVQVAMSLNRTDILQLMLQEPHRIPNLLTSVSQDEWISIIKLLSTGRKLNVPSHFLSKLDAVRFVIRCKLWDPNFPNENGSIALHFASSDIVECLVSEQGCDVNHQDERGNTPLHVACLRGELDSVETISSLGKCNINLQNEAGDTPLHIACREGHTVAVILLSGIEHCNFNLRNKSGQTPAQVAMCSNSTNILQLMFQEPHHIPSLLASVSQGEQVSMIDALGGGRELTVPSHFQSKLDAVEFVVQHKLWDPKCPNENGSIALHFASSDLVEYLVHEQGCDVNHQNKSGNTPLHVACLRGDLDTVRALTSNKRCNINLQDKAGDTPLHLACRERHRDIIVLLSGVEHCNFNLQNECCQTPVMIAVQLNHTEILQFMLQELHCIPSLLTCVSQDEWISIIKLLSGGRKITVPSHFLSKLDAVKSVVRRKLWDPKCPNKRGSNALHFASSDLVQYLVHEQGCDVNHQNERGNTPLHVACLRGDLDSVETISSLGKCNINLQNEAGDTPLHIACREGHTVAVILLSDIEHCNFNLQNKSGQTPVQVSMCCNSTDMLQLMFQEPHHIPSLIASVSQDEQVSMIDMLGRGRELTVPSHFQSKLDAVKFVTQYKLWDPKCPNEKGSIALHFASSDLVEYLVHEQGCDVNHQNKRGNTPLHVACLRGDLGTVIALTSNKRCNINLQNKTGDTPLHIACRERHRDMIVIISSLERCNFNLQNERSQTPAQVAVYLSHTNILQLMLQEPHHIPNLLKSVSQDEWITIIKLLSRYRKLTVPSHFLTKLDAVKFVTQYKLWDPKCPNENGSIALHFASSDLVEYLVHEQGCDVNHQNKRGNTPLHVACIKGELDSVEAIVSLGKCNINLQNKAGDTPLHIACRKGHTVAVILLCGVEHCNFNLQNKHGHTPTMVAMIFKHTDILQLMLQEPHLIPSLLTSTSVSQDRWITIINHLSRGRELTVPAQFLSKLDAVKFVIRCKLWDPKSPNENGSIALHFASSDLVEYLVHEQGCDVNHQNDRGNTPLHVACLRGDLGTVRTLTSIKMCTINLQNKAGDTPLHVACLRGDTDTIAILILFERCNSSLQNEDGNTPLHIACRDGYTDSVVLLSGIEHCNFNHKNKSGQTPVQVAMSLNRTDILQLMLKEPHRIPSLLTSVSQDEWITIIKLLSSDRELTVPSHFLSKLDVVKFVVQHKLWNPKCPNENGSIALHFASSDLVEYLVHEQGCDVNHRNKKGNTPLHVACLRGDLGAVRALTSIAEFDLNFQNKDGNTPLHVACLRGDLGTIRALTFTDRYNINIKNEHGNTLLHIACCNGYAEVIKMLTGVEYCNINIQNKEGNTPLHVACLRADSSTVSALVSIKGCNINLQNQKGKTPLHIACQSGNLEAVRVMVKKCSDVNESTCFLDVPNNQGDTPLHCACSIGHVQIVKMLLSTDLFDPTSCNIAGLTPINLTTEFQVIKELSAYAKFRSSQPIWSNVKVCVVGDHSTGKTTLVEVLSKEVTRFWKILPPRFRRITNVEYSTAGIILVRLQSKNLGNVILYDFAGHKEYYSSHAAVLENFRSTSPPPLFLVLLKLTERMKDISEKLYYWTSMIENHCKLSTRPPKIVVVGSFADEVRSKGGSVQEVSKYVQQTINSLRAINPASNVVTSSLQFVRFIPLDCRVQASGPMNELSDLLARTCRGMQTAVDASFRCHILYTFLIDKCKGRVACRVDEIMESVQREDVLALYNDALSLVDLLKTLSDFGEIILLANQEKPGQGWVILESKVLLSEINATVFAPEYLRQYSKGFAMSTGVVPLSKIKETFPTYDSEMITQFLTHLEFCQEIKDLNVLPDIIKTHQMQDTASPSSSSAVSHTTVACYDQERYFFFSALVELEKPVRVWVDDETMQYKCGWLLQCIKPGKFLTTRFLHVLLLRLAFAYGLNPQPHQLPEGYLVLRKRCSVWKSGIQWFSRTGIETIVEVREQTKVVAVLMRCPKDKEVECAKLRSSVIGKTLCIQWEFCPAVTPMAESLIHPSDVEYPLKDARELRSFSVNEIANLVIADPSYHETCVIEDIPRGIIDTEDLLLFEPYLGLGAEIVQQLFSSDNEITEQFLNQLASWTFKRLSIYKKIINPNEAHYAELCEQAPFNQVKQCFYLFQLWSERGDTTFKALRQLFDGCSIFHGRNPLELASCVPHLSSECSHEEVLLEHVDDTELAIHSLLPVRTELVTLTCWFDLGLAVQLLPHTLTAIRTSNRGNIHQCLTDVVAAWLERQDNVSKPSWRSLVEALLSPSVNCQTLARRIAETHSTSQSKPETHLSTTEHSTVQDVTVECHGSSQYEKSFSQHDPETHHPTTDVSMSIVQDMDDATLEDDSLHDIKHLLMAGGTHLPWFSLGLVLGLYYGTLKCIQSKNRDNQSGCLTDTLVAWLRQEDAVPEEGLPSWRSLARALAHPLVNQRGLVHEITKRHKKIEPSHN